MKFEHANRFKHQNQIGAEIDQGLFGRRPVAQQNPEGDRRVFAPVNRNLFGQEIGQEGLATGDGDVAASFAREIGDLALDPFHIGQLAANMMD